MSPSSLTTRRHRWRSAAAGIAVALSAFTLAACGEEEPAEDSGVEEVEEEEREEDD